MKSVLSNRLYLFVFIWCLGVVLFSVYVWFAPLRPPSTHCFFKIQYGIPCAGCGGSHAIQSLLHGQWSAALLYNPLAVVVFISSLVLSVIFLYDLMFSRNYLVQLVQYIQWRIRFRFVSIYLAILLMASWIYIIYRYC